MIKCLFRALFYVPEDQEDDQGDGFKERDDHARESQTAVFLRAHSDFADCHRNDRKTEKTHHEAGDRQSRTTFLGQNIPVDLLDFDHVFVLNLFGDLPDMKRNLVKVGFQRILERFVVDDDPVFFGKRADPRGNLETVEQIDQKDAENDADEERKDRILPEKTDRVDD